MSEAPAAYAEVPAKGGGGFPPFRTETFPSQLFWLAITFILLFVVLWRIAGPRIAGVIAERKKRILADLEQAERHRREAEEASAAYQAALLVARARAQAVADENRRRVNMEVERAKASADAEAQEAIAAAEAHIATMRESAKANVAAVAQDAAKEIVDRLIGGPASSADAAVKPARTGTG
jgi:F-type H+-transporting ATPase subunit b